MADAPGTPNTAKKPPALILPTIAVHNSSQSTSRNMVLGGKCSGFKGASNGGNYSSRNYDFQCPLICEQGPSIPSSPTGIMQHDGLTTADVMARLQMFTSQYDSARLSPNYATSDLGSSARSSFSTAGSWTAYREHTDNLISPFECDTACSVSPSFSLSPMSANHFSFDVRSVSSLSNNFLTVGGFELSRERSRSESDMVPKDDRSHSTISVPCYGKKSMINKYNQERSSSTPPPTTSERDEIAEKRRAVSRLEDVDATNALVTDWAKNKELMEQFQHLHNMLNQQTPTTPVALKGATKLSPKPVDESMAYTCQLCGQAFAVHDRLAKHIASRHRQRSCTLDDASKIHKCGQCSKSFSRSDMLTRHMRLHTGAKPYSCPTCAQVFSRSDHLSTHLRTHTGEKPYACPLCNYSASRRDMISRHMRTHSDSQLDVSTPISQLSIRSATTSPLPPKNPPVEIGSGELSAFKPINPR